MAFTGAPTLPAGWASSASLRSLRLVNVTGLAGALPAEWPAGLPALASLVLDGVTGLSTVPGDYVAMLSHPVRTAPAGNYTGLVTAVLAGMGLSGPVPGGLFGSPKLVSLSLARNALTGPLNGSWAAGGGGGLRALDLSFNALSGSLPAGWSNFTLDSLSLAHNSLTGGRGDGVLECMQSCSHAKCSRARLQSCSHANLQSRCACCGCLCLISSARCVPKTPANAQMTPAQ